MKNINNKTNDFFYFRLIIRILHRFDGIQRPIIMTTFCEHSIPMGKLSFSGFVITRSDQRNCTNKTKKANILLVKFSILFLSLFASIDFITSKCGKELRFFKDLCLVDIVKKFFWNCRRHYFDSILFFSFNCQSPDTCSLGEAAK